MEENVERNTVEQRERQAVIERQQQQLYYQQQQIQELQVRHIVRHHFQLNNIIFTSSSATMILFSADLN